MKALDPYSSIFFLFLFLFFIWPALIFFAKHLKTSFSESIVFLLSLFLLFSFLAAINFFLPAFGFSGAYLWLNFLFPAFFSFFLFFFIFKIAIREILIIFAFLFLIFLLTSQTFFLKDFRLKFLNFAFLFLFLPFGIYLIKSKLAEIKTIEKAKKITKEKEELLRAKDQFILSIQHHLRTPFTPLKGYLERILEGNYGPIENPIIRQKLFEMKKLSDILGSLMEDLLDIQQIKMGKEILALEDCQIEKIIEGLIEELKPEAEKKGLYLNFLKTPLPKMKLDKRRIREAIFNLLDNAIKYTNRGGVEIKASLIDKKCQITISDTGIGMSKEEIENFLKGRIFERSEMAKKFYGPGRGIGLAIAVEFIKAHGGKISAHSEGFGKGTTFYVEIPLKT